MKAIWNGETIAESNDTIVIENNHYFPKESVNPEFIAGSETHSTCPWKGIASYYSIIVNDKVNRDAAWFYPQPKPAASQIKDRVAFWKGVEVIE